jgi:hypothetical protein
MTFDPVCAMHGKRWSEHEGGRCLYCCQCFKSLTPEECSVLPDGSRVDVCVPCALREAEMIALIPPNIILGGADA